MEKNRENIDHLFKQELGSYTETPPAAVWEALEKRLGETRRKRAFPYMRLWYISLASVIVLLGSAMAWYMAGNAHSPAIATTVNAPARPLAAVTTTGTTDNTKTPGNADKTAKHTKQYQSANSATGIAGNATHTITHKTIKRTHKTNDTTTSKTNDDLYADTDDDQYTVGYSSNSHVHNDATENETAEYTVQPHSQHNIVVAEMDPQQQTNGHVYGSTARVTKTTALPATVSVGHNSSEALVPARTAGSYAATATADEQSNRLVTHHSRHIHKAPISNAAISANTTTAKHATGNIAAAARPNSSGVAKEKQATVTPRTTPLAATMGRSRGHLRAKHINPAAETPAVAVSKPVEKHSDKIAAAPAHKKPTRAVSKTPAAPGAHNAGTVAVATPGKTNSTTGQQSKLHNKPVAVAATPTAAVVKNNTTAVTAEEKKIAGKPHINKEHTFAAASTVNHTKEIAAKAKTPAVAATAAQAKAPTERAVVKNNSHIAAVKKTEEPQAPAGSKQMEVKAGQQVAAAIAPIKKPVVAKTMSTVNAPAKENIAVKVKQTKNKQVHVATTAKQNAVAIKEKRSGAKGAASKASGNTTQVTVPPTPPVLMYSYSRSLTPRTVEDETAIADNVKVNTFAAQQPAIDTYEQLLPSTFKPVNGVKVDSALSVAADGTARHHLFSKKFEAGVKAGYETGFNKAGANKAVVSPYLQYNLTDRFSLMTQPSVKVSHVAERSVGNPRSYVDTSKGSVTKLDSGVIPLIITSGGITVQGSEELRKYMYTQTYDSIVKSSAVGGTYMEFEVPLLLKYALYKHLSVYGGANFIFGKLVTTSEQTYNSGPLVKSKIGVTVTPSGEPVPPPPAMGNVIQYSSPLLSTYSGPAFPASSGDLLRIGYMLGFSYEYKKRWLLDVLMQQAMVKPRYEGGYNTNAPLALPYFRFTIGYKLTK